MANQNVTDCFSSNTIIINYASSLSPLGQLLGFSLVKKGWDYLDKRMFFYIGLNPLFHTYIYN